LFSVHDPLIDSPIYAHRSVTKVNNVKTAVIQAAEKLF
jgi:hypothetical protein